VPEKRLDVLEKRGFSDFQIMTQKSVKTCSKAVRATTMSCAKKDGSFFIRPVRNAKTITIPASRKIATLYSVWFTVTESGRDCQFFCCRFQLPWGSVLGLPRFQSARLYPPVHTVEKIAIVHFHSASVTPCLHPALFEPF
jgi:hypothetical protein